MSVCIVTGSAGLIGSEAVRFFADQGLDVIGIDNNMRQSFFGPAASTDWNRKELERTVRNYRHVGVDIRDGDALERLFKNVGPALQAIVHCAAQPSHDWAAKDVFTDFSVNANGTLNLLEYTRKYCAEAVFIHMSTNKVYGDRPNALPMVELEHRYEIAKTHPYHHSGIDEQMSIDASMHSMFGVSKTAADLLVQEYGRYFGLKTAVFRGGCLTGPSHSGAELHGFLAYLMHCTLVGKPYTVFGYKGKQVRDNIHSRDVVRALWVYFKKPRCGAVYNLGGGRFANCSMLEAIALSEEIAGKKLQWSYSEQPRMGDHVWYISDVSRFMKDYPEWSHSIDLLQMLTEYRDSQTDRVRSVS